MSEIDKPIARIIGIYQSALSAKDVDALMQLYHPEVRVFDAWGVWSHEGAAAWRIAVEGWFVSLGSEKIRVSFEEVNSSLLPDSAFVSAIVTYAGLSAEGVPLRAMQNRLSWCLRTSGHVLRIVHEHTSAPIGFDDQKAILTRPAART